MSQTMHWRAPGRPGFFRPHVGHASGLSGGLLVVGAVGGVGFGRGGATGVVTVGRGGATGVVTVGRGFTGTGGEGRETGGGGFAAAGGETCGGCNGDGLVASRATGSVLRSRAAPTATPQLSPTAIPLSARPTHSSRLAPMKNSPTASNPPTSPIYALFFTSTFGGEELTSRTVKTASNSHPIAEPTPATPSEWSCWSRR